MVTFSAYDRIIQKFHKDKKYIEAEGFVDFILEETDVKSFDDDCSVITISKIK